MAAVIGQFDRRALPAAEQRLVLPFDAREAHQIAGLIVGGGRGRSEVAQHVGGQRAGRIRAAAGGG